jgi:hypothetical protein
MRTTDGRLLTAARNPGGTQGSGNPRLMLLEDAQRRAPHCWLLRDFRRSVEQAERLFLFKR